MDPALAPAPASPPVVPTAATAAARERALRAAIAALRADRPVAFPTETVWGLAACARSAAAVEAVRRWKGRGDRQPMAVLVSSVAVLDDLGIALPALARRLAEVFWPGPLTLVVPTAVAFAPGVARADGALGLRCSPHPAAHALGLAAEAEGLGPLTATSLNRTGDPPAADRRAARALCGGPGDPWLFADVADGFEDARGAEPSTVVDVTSSPARIVRWGAIAAEALERFADAIDLRGPAQHAHRQGDQPA
jgi:L-threonylcarbamoyladenylate synthase